jgi:hypothetical protein
MKSDDDDRKFFACCSEYERLLEIDNQEKWVLFESGVLEKIIEVNHSESMNAQNSKKSKCMNEPRLCLLIQ